MHFAIDTPNFGDFANPRLLAELAHETENAGWDGFFLWDHIGAGWLLIEPLLPAALSGGRKQTTDMREVVNGIFYWLRSGCAWSLLPHDFPPYATVYGYFNQWRKTGVWQMLNDALYTAVRTQEEREAKATAGSIDSQTVKTTHSAPADRGFDGGKQINGRKRFILVDTRLSC
jgi:putative transposase